MIIGLTGRIASGKGSIAYSLVWKGFKKIIISDIIKDEVVKRGLPVVRENLQNVGDEVRQKEGTGAWIKRMNLVDGENYVIDGIRNPGEISELKKYKNFFLISVDAPQKIRYERIVSRGQDRDKMTWEEFVAKDNREIAEKDSARMQLQECMNMADFKIENKGTLKELNEKVEDILNKIRA